MQDMKPKIDLTSSTKKAQGRNLRKIPNECKRYKMNRQYDVGMLGEELYEGWRKFKTSPW